MRMFGDSPDYLLDLGREQEINRDYVHKFGCNTDIDQTRADIWDGGGATAANGTYDFASTAETLYISSEDATDDQSIVVAGLDGDWAPQEQSVTLSGKTQTEIGSSLTWMRSFRAYNNSSSNLAGVIYIYSSGTVTSGIPQTAGTIRAIISAGHDQSLMAIYTVPADKTGYFIDYYASIAKKTAVFCNIKVSEREFEKVFRTKEFMGLNSGGDSYMHHKFDIPHKLKAKTDIVMSADSSANDATVSAGFDIMLADNA